MSQVYMILKNILAWDDMYRERCTVGHWIQLIVMLFWLIWPSRNPSATTMSSSKSSVFGVLKSVRKAYQLRYKCSLEEDLAQHTNGDIRKLLVALVTAYRCDGNEINVKLANSEANILQDAIKDKCFNHEEIIRILSTRSKTQLMATFNKYRDDHGNSISKNFLEDGANDFQKALHTAVRCLNDHKKCFEKVLRKVIIGTGTNEDALTRVIVTGAEKDLKDIMEVYYKKNSVPLEQTVAQDTSGDYKTFLLTLLGKD